MKKLEDKIVLITGSASGIGIACAKQALKDGAFKVILSDQNDLKSKERDISLTDLCDFIKLDVRSEGDWENTITYIGEKYGRLNVLINNAGITGTRLVPPALDIEQTSLESWREVHSVNLDGIFIGCRKAISLMKNSTGAAIVNIGSRSALVGRPDRIAYASSKAALSSLTKSIAIYCANKDYSIRCNTVLPSSILTSLWDPVLGEGERMNFELLKSLSSRIPMKRFGTPEEVAYAVIFLASDEASYITGTEIIVDGGAQANDSLRN